MDEDKIQTCAWGAVNFSPWTAWLVHLYEQFLLGNFTEFTLYYASLGDSFFPSPLVMIMMLSCPLGEKRWTELKWRNSINLPHFSTLTHICLWYWSWLKLEPYHLLLSLLPLEFHPLIFAYSSLNLNALLMFSSWRELEKMRGKFQAIFPLLFVRYVG